MHGVQTDGLTVKHQQVLNSGLILRISGQKYTITELCPTQDYNLGPLDLRVYMHRGSLNNKKYKHIL